MPADKLDRFAASHGTGRQGQEADGHRDGREEPYRTKPKLLSGGGGGVSHGPRLSALLPDAAQRRRAGRRSPLEEGDGCRDDDATSLPEEAMKAKNGGNADVGDGFGLGFGVRVGKDDPAAGRFVGEYYWGGAASTHFWISPKQDLAVVALEQFMPNRPLLQQAIKPLIYNAVRK